MTLRTGKHQVTVYPPHQNNRQVRRDRLTTLRDTNRLPMQRATGLRRRTHPPSRARHINGIPH